MRHLLLFLALVGIHCVSVQQSAWIDRSPNDPNIRAVSYGTRSAHAQDVEELGDDDAEDPDDAGSAGSSGGSSSSAQPTQSTDGSSSSAANRPRLQVTQVQPQQAQERSSAQVYLQQIQRIESQINELKEEVFRSRTRLTILKESVLASGLSGTELQIIHRNDMGANFKLERILYMLDGSPIRQAVDRDGDLDRQEKIEILNGPIAPGNHRLTVELIYRGNGFGVFSYLQSYRFTLNNATTFRAEEGKRVTISAIGYERSGVTLELKDRPDIRFDRSVVDLEEEAEARESKRPTPASRPASARP